MHCFEGYRGHRCFMYIGQHRARHASWACKQRGGRLPLPKNDNENEKLLSIRGISEGFNTYLRLLDLSGPASHDQNLQDSYGNEPSYTNWSHKIGDVHDDFLIPIPGDTRTYNAFMDPEGKWLLTPHLYDEYVDVVCEVIIGRISRSQMSVTIHFS